MEAKNQPVEKTLTIPYPPYKEEGINNQLKFEKIINLSSLKKNLKNHKNHHISKRSDGFVTMMVFVTTGFVTTENLKDLGGQIWREDFEFYENCDIPS